MSLVDEILRKKPPELPEIPKPSEQDKLDLILGKLEAIDERLRRIEEKLGI
ncbi:MAG: hypothetical protein GXO63_00015 [Candidatus Micrarchaeota archaeon]|nr:hypothetical protein [Candidatus Micrarchaeota archaeon]